MKKKIAIMLLVLVLCGAVYAATISKNWADSANVYQTNAYSGGDTDVAGTELYSDDIDLETSGYAGCQVTVNYTPSGTTDNLTLKIYGSLDGTNFDDVAMSQFTGTNIGASDTQISFVIKDLAHFRIGMVRSGSTDTFDVDINYQAYNYASN